MRRLLVLVVILVVVGSLGSLLVQHLGALPSSEIERFHMDSQGNQVGYFFRGCDSTRIREGNTTTQTYIAVFSNCGNLPLTCVVDCVQNGQSVSCTSPYFTIFCDSETCQGICPAF